MNAETGTADGKAVSLYQRILSEIRARILSGEWQPGHRIPFEHELSVEYGCSRMTVNKAMSELAKSGLIERRRRSGSFVSRPRSQAAILEIHDIRTEVQALGLPYRYQLMSHRTRDRDGLRRGGVRLSRGQRPARSHLPPFRRRAAVLPRRKSDQPRGRAGSGGRDLRRDRTRPLAARAHPVERRRTHDPGRGRQRNRRGVTQGSAQYPLPRRPAPDLERRPAGDQCPADLCRADAFAGGAFYPAEGIARLAAMRLHGVVHFIFD